MKKERRVLKPREELAHLSSERRTGGRVATHHGMTVMYTSQRCAPIIMQKSATHRSSVVLGPKSEGPMGSTIRENSNAAMYLGRGAVDGTGKGVLVPLCMVKGFLGGLHARSVQTGSNIRK